MIFAENWLLVQYEDQPDTLRVLNEQEVKHLDSGDEEDKRKGRQLWPVGQQRKATVKYNCLRSMVRVFNFYSLHFKLT